MTDFVGARLQLDCGPSVGTFVGTIVEVSDEKMTLKNALRNGLPSDTCLVTLHRSSIVGITMLRSAMEQQQFQQNVNNDSKQLYQPQQQQQKQAKDKENKLDHRVIEASLQEKTLLKSGELDKQQQARREAARERLLSIPNATPVYICQTCPISPPKSNAQQNGGRKGSDASNSNCVGAKTIGNTNGLNVANLVSTSNRRTNNKNGNGNSISQAAQQQPIQHHHHHARARSELVSNYVSYGLSNKSTSSNNSGSPTNFNVAIDHWLVVNNNSAESSTVRVPVVSEQFLESVLLAAEKLGLSMARMAESCGRTVADFLISQIGNGHQQHRHQHYLHSHHQQHASQSRTPPRFAVIIGGGRRGQFGLATARHLASRGAEVCAYIAATEPAERDQLGQEIRLYRSTGCPLVEHSRDLPWLLDCVLLASDQVDSPAHPLAQWFRACRAPLACLAPPDGNPACLSPRYNLHCCLPVATNSSANASNNYLCDIGVTRDAFQAAGLRGFAPGALFSRGFVVQLQAAAGQPPAK